ncbi:MAG: tRNA (N6-isopentenyl adenosine(37)-C2)-methylthiotransferase MiaB [Pseudomonadota bacterium]
MTTAKKSLYIKTYGCQMNVYDSTRMADVLIPEGYNETEDISDADVIVLNTCHIREKAAEKVYSELGRIRQIKDGRNKKGKKTLVAVAGCVAQAEGEEILQRAPVVDIVVGPQNYHRLPTLVATAQKTKQRLVDTNFQETDKFRILNKTHTKTQTTPQKRIAPSAFLTVQEGCDKFCTFCVVPYTRGVEYSRPVSDIITEAKKQVALGVREITLLGQNVNAYHGLDENGKSSSLASLLDSLSGIPNLERLRYTTSHPCDMSNDLIAAHRDNPKIMPYLHLPFQAGSDRILKAMNRKHTIALYFDLIDKIRAASPEIALSTDIIVGFPGESDADFEETLAVVEKVRFAQAYSFKYSTRPGTPAAEKTEQVPEHIKSERLQRLQKLLNQHQLAFNQSCVDRTLPVLFEKIGRNPQQYIGRSPYLQSVHVQSNDDLIGQIKRAKIVDAGPNSLQAELNMTQNSTQNHYDTVYAGNTIYN